VDIFPAGTRPSEVGPDSYFTGKVRIDPVINTPDPSRLRGAIVTFEPGARTAWHTHPLGQTLLILSGSGLAQTEGGAIRELRPGDTVWFAPGEKHWHGATGTNGMSHLALQEALDGEAVAWLEQVTEAQYSGSE
jgi:quercetin dioxygenase-like cupin family protein